MAMMVWLMNPGAAVPGLPFCVARSAVQSSELYSISGDMEGVGDNAWPQDEAENSQNDWPEDQAL